MARSRATARKAGASMSDRYPPRPQDCDTCNMHGPELPTFFSALIDLHRASHDLMLAIAQPFIDFLAGCARWMKIELKKEAGA